MYTPMNIKRNSKYGSNYWEAFSLKLNRRVRLFSDLEYDQWVMIESDPSIKTFCEQPFSIKMFFEGEVYESIPDMWAMKHDGTEFLIEVKYTTELNLNVPKNRGAMKKIRAYKLWCKMNHFSYLLRTEQNIRRNPIYLQNLKTILSFLRWYPCPTEVERQVIIQLLNCRKMKIYEIEQSLPQLSGDQVRGLLYWLLYQGIIQADLKKTIFNNQTEVWLKGE